MARYGHTWTDEDQAHCIGGPLPKVGAYMSALAHGADDPAFFEEELVRLVAEQFANGLEFMPGAQELVHDLVATGVPMALVSASPRLLVDSALALLPTGTFITSISSQDVSISKPNPESYFKAASHLEVQISNCLVLEDSKTGIDAGLATTRHHPVYTCVVISSICLHAICIKFSNPRVKRNLMPPEFNYGDRVQLTDAKGKIHTITLKPGGEWHTHKGWLIHDQIVGAPQGSVVETTAGLKFLAFKPLYGDYVLSMPRGATIVYPKDAALIVGFADIAPGLRVLEAGVGSGALTIALLRAVGQSGQVDSFERRDEFAQIATRNVTEYFNGKPENWSLTLGSLQDKSPEEKYDRMVLDMLAPWEC
eukprot:gene945-953_t